MYRQYENPHKLEAELEELIKERENISNEDELIELEIAISELKDRVNFAWQDDEYNYSESDY